MSPRALVVDDDAAVRRVLSRLLTRFGLSTDEAQDGEYAVQLAASRSYQLILLDAQMPRCSGIDAAIAIRSIEDPLAPVPIFLLTGALTDEVRAASLAAGIDGCLCKPVTLQEIESLVKRVLADASAPPVLSGGEAELEPAFQPTALLDAAGGDADAFDEMVALFVTQSTSALAELDRAVRENETTLLKRRVHKLRGTTAMVGAGKLAALVTSVGTSPNEQTLSMVERELMRVISAMRALGETLR